MIENFVIILLPIYQYIMKKYNVYFINNNINKIYRFYKYGIK